MRVEHPHNTGQTLPVNPQAAPLAASNYRESGFVLLAKSGGSGLYLSMTACATINRHRGSASCFRATSNFKLRHLPAPAARCQVDSMLHCGLNQNPWRFVRDSRDIAAGARLVAASREARSCPTKTGRYLRTC